MFVDGIGRGAQRIIDAMVRWLAVGHINPNILTLIGVSLNVGCGLLFGFGQFFWAGIVLIIANLFDMLDGQVARGRIRLESPGHLAVITSTGDAVSIALTNLLRAEFVAPSNLPPAQAAFAQSAGSPMYLALSAERRPTRTR